MAARNARLTMINTKPRKSLGNSPVSSVKRTVVSDNPFKPPAILCNTRTASHMCSTISGRDVLPLQHDTLSELLHASTINRKQHALSCSEQFTLSAPPCSLGLGKSSAQPNLASGTEHPPGQRRYHRGVPSFLKRAADQQSSTAGMLPVLQGVHPDTAASTEQCATKLMHYFILS